MRRDTMKEIIINKNNLSENDITEIVKRVKVLIINSNNEILLGYSHNEYQFPGGHIEENESFNQAINREIQEETGIKLNIKNIEPFVISRGYYKDWPQNGKNRKVEIYYYEIRTDEKPDLNNTSYTENEKNGNFELRYIPLDEVENEIMNNVLKYNDEKGIGKEMIEIFKIYKSIN